MFVPLGEVLSTISITGESFKHTGGKFLNPSESFSSWEVFPDAGPGRQPNTQPGIEDTLSEPIKHLFTKLALSHILQSHTYTIQEHIVGSYYCEAKALPPLADHLSFQCTSYRFL